MKQYFEDLGSAYARIATFVKPSGRIMIVVQGSYYKELLVDLQAVTIELLELNGCDLVARHDYEISHHRTRINPRARQRAAHELRESLLVFERTY